jgi:hypothetical protein
MKNNQVNIETAIKFYQDNVRLIESTYNNEGVIKEVLKLDAEVVLMFFVRYKNKFNKNFETMVAEKFKNVASSGVITHFVNEIKHSKTSLIFKDKLLKEATVAELLRVFHYCDIPFQTVFDKVIAENDANNLFVLGRDHSWRPLVKSNLDLIESLILASDNKYIKSTYALKARDFYVFLEHFKDTYDVNDVVDLLTDYYLMKIEEVRDECEERIEDMKKESFY